MGVNVTITSYRVEVEKKIDSDIDKKMALVGRLVENEAKVNVSKSPPEHPQVQTGQLRSSITHEVEKTRDETTALIGTPVKHGLYLELGTVKMQPYPWLLPAVESNREQIKEIIGSHTTELQGNIE